MNNAITFTDASTVSSGTIVNWYWNFGDLTNATYATGAPFTKKYDTSGNYTVKLAVKTDKGCVSDTLLKVVTIHELPVVNFIMPQVCLSDAIAQFKDSSYIADGTINAATYLWNFGDANATTANPNTSTQRNGAHSYAATGYYNVSLTVTSNNGCVVTNTKQFTLNGSLPKSDFTVLNNNGLCSNTTVQIQNGSSVNFGTITKVEIIWDAANAPSTIVTDSFAAVNKIYAHAYPALQTTTIYQVKFRAYSGISCVDETTKTITVNASPKVTFSTIPGICLDANARQITQTGSGGVAGTGVFSGTGVSSTGRFTPSLAGVGAYNLHYLYTSDQGCKDSADQTITVWPSPTANWAYSSPTCINGAITFSDSSLANFSKITQWNWNFGEGTNSVYTNNTPFTKIKLLEPMVFKDLFCALPQSSTQQSIKPMYSHNHFI